MNDTIPYPVRINRYLFLKRICSRREADRLIAQGKVHINGRPAVIGEQVHEGDAVDVDSKVTTRTYRYLLYHKPPGIVSHNPQRDEVSIHQAANLPARIVPLGRLDKASRGLMLLSDDGRIVNALLNPAHGHERTYEVAVNKYIKGSHLKQLARGVVIEGYQTKPAQVKRLGDTRFELTLTEGKKHQIRRMCAALGYTVNDLLRTRILHLSCDMPEGTTRALTENEVATLLRVTGITPKKT